MLGHIEPYSASEQENTDILTAVTDLGRQALPADSDLTGV